MNPWLQLLGSAAVGAVLAAVVAGLFSRRKLSAEATKIITDAASGVVQNLRDENARVIASNAALSKRLAALQKKVDADHRLLHKQGEMLSIHAFWDQQAVAIAREHDIELPPPPPLYTPPPI